MSEAQPSRTHHRLAGATTADSSRVISVTTDAIADILGRLCRWHRQLCDLVDMVAACYGLLLFIVIMYYFTSSVLATYEITTFFHRTGHSIHLRPVIDCVTCGCRLILISVIPSMTVTQVSTSMYSTILFFHFTVYSTLMYVGLYTYIPTNINIGFRTHSHSYSIDLCPFTFILSWCSSLTMTTNEWTIYVINQTTDIAGSSCLMCCAMTGRALPEES